MRAVGRRVIALISGEVALRRATYVVVDCGGVGYQLTVSAETLSHVPAVGERVTLHTQLVVRDDALQLYGFATEDERELFQMLLSVQSVGPKVAIAVLSGGPPHGARVGAGGGRHGALSGRSGDRQADRGADHRRATREGHLGRPRADDQDHEAG